MTPTQAQKAKDDAPKDTSKDEPQEFSKPEGESDAAQSVVETDTPRDPSQAIPKIALDRYLDPTVAGQASNPQL